MILRKISPLRAIAAFLFVALAINTNAADWKPAGETLLSKFAKDVDPANPLPEYPRPQMVRPDWKNLNGLWEYAIAPSATTTAPTEFQGEILVPYPIESALSGVAKRVGRANRLWYKTVFEIPADWKEKNVVLHFGAVDWDTIVYLNGEKIGMHQGGYDPFSFDITAALKDGKQELVLSVWDPSDRGTQPRGKQVNNPGEIWYTPVTGIWQTVWLEPVADASIQRLRAIPKLSDGTVELSVYTKGTKAGDEIQAVIDGKTFKGSAEKPLTLKIENVKTWSPASPYLYDYEVSIIRDGKALDTVKTYLGMREITLGKCKDGFIRMLLNGEFVFQHGPLDQGWWPDGLYTAPTDEALKFDVVKTKEFGFNMLRKHVKVEPARFYYHCDKLGILVWQDMPNGDGHIDPTQPDIKRTPESAAIYEKEWKAIIESLDNSPSIVVWVPFNEGWGQYDTDRILAWTKELDPSRLVDGPSGWADRKSGDMIDMHAYRGPGMFPVEEKRATVLGEYGGLGLPIKDHQWVDSKDNWGYGGNLKGYDDLLETYCDLNRKMHPLIAKGLSAAVYTQTTDVEVEVNGLMSYDREVIKMDIEKLRASNELLHYPAPKIVTIAQDAREKAVEWQYTTEKPAEGWEKADFDDSSWKTGKSGFGTAMTPGAKVGTVWNSNNIWLRRSFDLKEDDLKNPEQLMAEIHHDEDVNVYINGVLVFKKTGWTTGYSAEPFITGSLEKALKAGKNVVAIDCLQKSGGQYIDFGISRIVPPVKSDKPIW